MTPGRAALIGLIDRYRAGLLDPFVTLLEVHKLMYFLPEAGEPLKLRLVKAPYGPYAENLREVLQAMEGAYLEGYGDGCDEPDKELELLSTVHWVMRREEATSEEETVARTYAWGERKRRFSRGQILLAREVLIDQRWIERAAS